MLRQLGNTGITVSALGLGTVKFGRNQQVKYPTAFNLPTDEELIALLNTAQELGINFLDTAPAYGSSEERLGKLLNKRSDWVICGKAGEEFINGESYFDFSPPAIMQSVERSLNRLKTDYLDILLIHSNGDDVKIIQEQEVFNTLANVKRAGKIRAFGMSTKTIEGGLLTIEHADIAMVTYHPEYIEEYPIIQQAHKKHKGILIKKALASGHLANSETIDPVLKNLQFILQTPGVSSVMVGTLNPQHLKHNIACVKQALGQ